MKPTLIILICLFSRLLHAQDIPDYSLKHSIRQDGLTHEFTVRDSDDKPVRKHHTFKTYYWYRAQHVIGTQAGHSGQLLHGKYVAYYPSKQLYAAGNFSKGLKNGKWQHWDETGTLLSIENWKKGELKGRQYSFSQDGKLQKITTIGRKAKTKAVDSLEWINGRRRQVETYDSLGRRLSMEKYRNGLLHGTSRYYSDSGIVKRKYKHGVLVQKHDNKESASDKQKQSRLKNVFRKKSDPEKTVEKPQSSKQSATRKKKWFQFRKKPADGVQKQSTKEKQSK